MTRPLDTEQLTPPEFAAWGGLLRAHRALVHELDAELSAAHGLPLRSYEVLVKLHDAPRRRMRMTALSRSVLLSASGVTRLVDRLERDGYVCRQLCTEDGRGAYAELTEAGADKLTEAQPTHRAGIRRLFLRHFDDNELGRLDDYWKRVLGGVGEAAPGAAGRRRRR
jgi:DNA-binding MarR family transcriptional regulator